MRVKSWLVVFAAASLLQLGTVPSSLAVDGVNSVDQLLRRLSHTLQERNYRGLFTYEYGGTLDTLEIVHVVEDGVEYERLQHLSGPSREFVRRGRPVDCVNHAAQLLRGGLFSPGRNSIHLHQYYDLSLGGEERVAGRTGTIVRIMPKDQYRYGLTLSVDRASGFPMKSLVISDKRKVLERIQFVELDFDVSMDKLREGANGAASMDLPATHSSCNNADSVNSEKARTGVAGTQDVPSGTPDWHAAWVPHGFVLTERSYSAVDGHQLTYTDGLASFSVFVAPVGPEGPTEPSLAQRGATVALRLTRPLDDYPAHVTVVGEIPPVTAEQVAVGLRPVLARELP